MNFTAADVKQTWQNGEWEWAPTTLMDALVTPELGIRLKHRRLELGWSLRELESRSGVNNSIIHKLETGQIRDTSVEKVQALTAALGLSAVKVLIELGCLDEPEPDYLVQLLARYLPGELIDQIEAQLNSSEGNLNVIGEE